MRDHGTYRLQRRPGWLGVVSMCPISLVIFNLIRVHPWPSVVACSSRLSSCCQRLSPHLPRNPLSETLRSFPCHLPQPLISTVTFARFSRSHVSGATVENRSEERRVGKECRSR